MLSQPRSQSITRPFGDAHDQNLHSNLPSRLLSGTHLGVGGHNTVSHPPTSFSLLTAPQGSRDGRRGVEWEAPPVLEGGGSDNSSGPHLSLGTECRLSDYLGSPVWLTGWPNYALSFKNSLIEQFFASDEASDEDSVSLKWPFHVQMNTVYVLPPQCPQFNRQCPETEVTSIRSSAT